MLVAPTPDVQIAEKNSGRTHREEGGYPPWGIQKPIESEMEVCVFGSKNLILPTRAKLCKGTLKHILIVPWNYMWGVKKILRIFDDVIKYAN